MDRCIRDQDDYRNHRDIPALPFSASRKSIPRQKPKGYPKELKTIGDHIRAWRMDHYLTQAELAKKLVVCDDTIAGWEMRRTEPGIKQMPQIIEAIGYLPIDIETSSLGGKIRYYRYINGLSQEELAKILGINESTVFHYEKNIHQPLPKILKKLKILL